MYCPVPGDPVSYTHLDVYKRQAKFSGEQKIPDYDGHVITISDVIELYDEDGSLFYYVDTNDFRPVAFGGPEPVQTQMIQL